MSSTKSSRPTAGHVIETNASGIVTIVIDDDFSPTQTADDSSDGYTVDSCRSSRPAIGVRTPVPTLGSPKFINSENSQNLLIKENKTNVIVVNSGRAPTRSDQSPFSARTPCCSPAPSDLQTHHNIISKSQTHYVVINKPKPSVSSTVTSSPSSPEQKSPTKLRLWTQPLSQSTPRSPTVVVSMRTRSHTNLPPDDVESDSTDDKAFFKYLNLVPTAETKHKSKLDLSTNWPLRKINKIAKPEVTTDGELVLANFKLLCETTKPVQNMESQLCASKLRWYKEARNYNEKLNHFRANLPVNPIERQRIQSNLEQIHGRLMTEKSKQSADEEKYRRQKAQEESHRTQKQLLSQLLDSYADSFEISSFMGRRVRLSLETYREMKPLSPQQVYELISKFERLCKQDNLHAFITGLPNSKLSTRITRSTTGVAGLDRMWGPRSDSHQYSFTRRQRLNRYMRLETGLNWKSRLVKKHCRSIGVAVAKINRCPCCLQLVEPEWGHSCRDSDEESIPDVSSVNDSEFGLQSDNMTAEEVSINSEIITANSGCQECGRDDCNLECESSSEPSIELYPPTAKAISKKGDTTLVLPAYANISPVAKRHFEDTITIQKVPHNRKTENNTTNGLKRKLLAKGESDDIVLVSEVRANSTTGLNRIKIKTENIVVSPIFLTPDHELTQKAVVKQNINRKRLRSQRNTSDDIIIRKIIK